MGKLIDIIVEHALILFIMIVVGGVNVMFWLYVIGY